MPQNECLYCLLIFISQIISNTTISRPESVDQNPISKEAGGLSGKPLFDLSTNTLKDMYMLTKVGFLSSHLKV